jgi:3-deoxy-7-phosphoheptulonate synthase
VIRETRRARPCEDARVPARTVDLRVTRVRPLLSPAVLAEELPCPEELQERLAASRRAVEDALFGPDDRLVVVVGPCSVHDPEAAVAYADKLAPWAARLAGELVVVMRVYFEKPRTVVGWKGLINDPDLDGSYHINKGLRLARKLLLDVAKAGVPAGTEFLDTTFGQFYADLVSWGAIGARTTESQIHRELASGLSMPVGFKNRTDGDMQVAVDAIVAARHRHIFPTLTKEGAPCIYETAGNNACHLVLRGGRTGPNHGAASIADARARLRKAAVPEVVMVDCSHDNSGRDPTRQPLVAGDIAGQIAAGERALRGVMLESHLVGGRQDLGPRASLVFGKSVTDACLGFDDTVPVLQRLAEAVARGREVRQASG